MTFLKNNKGLIVLLVVLVVLAALYPVYFISDDWEDLAFYHQVGREGERAMFWLWRFPFAVLFHRLFFPLFVHGHFFFGKLLLWSCALTSAAFISAAFIDSFWKRVRGSIPLSLALLAMIFAPNNFEWSFWPTIMTYWPGFLFIAIPFYSDRRHPGWASSLVKALGYTAAFFTHESLLGFILLLELASALYRSSSFTARLRHFAIGMAPTLGVIIVTKLILHYGVVGKNIYYGATLGFKGHLFFEFIKVSFLADYYKLYYVPGGLFAAAYLLLFFRHGRPRLADTLLVIAYILGGMYYYVIMDYSSRRALGGPLLFLWGWSIFSLAYLLPRRRLTMGVTLLIAIAFGLHQFTVFKFKWHEKTQIERNVAELRERVLHSPSPISISLDQPRTNLGRSWNFVNALQLEGYLRHYLSPEELQHVRGFAAPH